MHGSLIWVLALMFGPFASNSWGQEGTLNLFDYDSWESQGEVSLENRYFQDDLKANSVDKGNAVFARIDSFYSDDIFQLKIRGFARMDDRDPQRNMIRPEDVYLGITVDNLEVRGGYQLYNWSTMEVFHPVDVINSQNFDSDAEKLEKFGELAFSLIYTPEVGGKFDFHFFPRFQAPHFPGPNSRLGPGIQLSEPIWVVADQEFSGDNYGVQWAAHGNFTFADIDFDVHWLRVMDRQQPRFGLRFDSTIHPYFFYVNQVGGAFQWAMDTFILKGEAVYRKFDDVEATVLFPGSADSGFPAVLKTLTPLDHSIIAMGIERNEEFNGISAGFFIEGQYLGGVSELDARRMSLFQKDVMFGMRLAFNDLLGKEIFASVIQDLDVLSEKIYVLRYSQRLSDTWKIFTGVRVIEATPASEDLSDVENNVGLTSVEASDHVYFNISRFF